jgi:hypothetical protein
MDITKKEFEKMYYELSIADMAKKLDVSHMTIHIWRKSLDIKPKGRSRKINLIQERDKD